MATGRRALLVLALLAATSAAAHEIGSAKVEITLAKDGRYTVVAKIDPEHVAPGPLRTSRETLRREFIEKARIAFDGVPRELVETDESKATPLPDWPAFILKFSGRIPAEAKGVTFRQDAAIGWYLVQVINEGIEGSASQWLDVGKESKPFAIAAPPPAPTLGSTVAQYVVLGYQHIVPKGLDHILFVLGLFLMSTRWRALLAQVTAFTVAHSITLGLAIYGALSLPSTVVEPLIAASIVYVAIENVLAKELHKSRIAVVFCFGLLHGLGFASALQAIGLPSGDIPLALIAFNVGLDAALLAFVLAWLLLGAALRSVTWPAWAHQVPLYAMGTLGAFWSFQRAAALLR